MSLGKRGSDEKQEPIWIEAARLATPAGHPFYERLNRLLSKRGFDTFAESACESFYAKMGRPGLPPGVYFRALLVGYFEGIDSERGIAWRTADSLALRSFLGFELGESTPDHSTISRTRRLIDVETHRKVFLWVLGMLAEEGLLKGNTVSVDGTTLEANAALRSIVRRDNGQGYDDFLKGLAKESGIETPTREQLAKLDRKRKKKGNNDDWKNPHDPDAQITKMKDGRTHLAHKAEHAVDLETGAVLAVTLQPATAGDTNTLHETLAQCGEHIREVAADGDKKAEQLNPEGPAELVLDKGYHSNDVLIVLKEVAVRSYCSEPDRGRRNWKNKQEEKAAVYENRRRIGGERGKRLLRQRGERVERSFAHMYETGAMRRTHLRRHDNIIKRLLIHAGAFNLGLVMRKISGYGTPRGFQGRLNAVLFFIQLLWKVSVNAMPRQWPQSAPHAATSLKNATPFRIPLLCLRSGAPFLKISSATDCQTLNAVLVDAANLARRIPPDDEIGQRYLNNIRLFTDSSVNAIRDISLLLRPSMLDDLGLIPALEWQARETSRRTGIDVRVSAQDVDDNLPDVIRTCVYRVAQEALQNISRHSGASHAKIGVGQLDGMLSLTIEDDGSGFEPLRTRGMGLLGMEERVRQLGGRLEVLSKPANGTTVRVSLPVPAPVRK